VVPGDRPIVVSVRGVTVRFGDVVALEDVSLEVRAGQTLVVIGPSGSGKSVLLDVVVGLRRPDAGEVRVFGTDMVRGGERALYAVRRRLGMLFAEGALFDSWTARENVELPLEHHTVLNEAERAAVAEEKLARVRLEGLGHRGIAALSGGQRRRVALARAMALDPELLLLDEPTRGLDPLTTAAIDELLRDLTAGPQTTALVVTHDMASCIEIADEIVVLDRGRIVERGSASDLAGGATVGGRMLRRARVETVTAPPGGGGGRSR
jgi:phospholipid/cholesterol/gamma-HCH transport system ATP-binding protein